MLEAMASGCLALAPRRLAYPEYVPPSQCYDSLEDDPQAEARAAADTLQTILAQRPAPVRPEDWRTSRLVADYRGQIEELTGQSG